MHGKEAVPAGPGDAVHSLRRAGRQHVMLPAAGHRSGVQVKLSILMPVYNEQAHIANAVKQALDVAYPCEIELVIVDDGSRDATADVLAALDDPRISLHIHPRNRGKG